MADGKCIIITCVMMMLLLCSCKTVNPYENNYYVLADDSEYLRALPGTEPDMQEISNWEKMRALQEEGGYMVIGISAFSQSWTPRMLALECARRNGARLVRFYHKDAAAKDKSRVDFDPTQLRGRTCGIPGGYAWMQIMHGTVPVTVNEQELYYPQFAYYLARRKHINPFGVYFRVSTSREPRVRSGIVVPRSPAAKQGIKPGDYVYSINGKRIRSAEDILPYAVNKQAIQRMEVTHE